jgi:hypothetical protein
MAKYSFLFAKKNVFVILCVFVGIIIVVNPSQQQLAQSQSCDSGILGDRDGDDIPDVWEIRGIDKNRDGKIDFDLAALGASPRHKDLFLEVDYMENHQPYSEVIPSVVESFREAPICNPDGIDGIRLYVQLDEQIPHQDSIPLTVYGQETWHGFYSLKDQYFGTALEKLDPNKDLILLSKNNIFHYVIFGHSYDRSGSSGISDGIPAMDFIVSLGNFTAEDPNTGHITGTSAEQAGTLMHEFGHNLNLGHGGADDVNCKPNYLSVMSYTRQFESPISNRPLDYSRSVIEPLNEDKLDEFKGVGASEPEGLLTTYGPRLDPLYYEFVTPTGEPIDWNYDTDKNDVGINSDVNRFPKVYACSQETLGQVLYGQDDWDSLIYNIVLHELIENTGTSREGIENFNSNNSTSLSNSTSMMTDALPNITVRGTDNEPSLDEEMTRKDVIGLNTELILSTYDAIKKEVSSNDSMSELSDDDGPANTEDIIGFYEDLFGTGESSESALSDESSSSNKTILDSVVSDDLNQAIAGLNKAKLSMDSSFGFALSDDQITDPDAQLELTGKIDNAIKALESQICKGDNCEVEQKAANSTIVYD